MACQSNCFISMIKVKRIEITEGATQRVKVIPKIKQVRKASMRIAKCTCNKCNCKMFLTNRKQ